MLKKDRVKLLIIAGGLVGLMIMFFLAYRYIAPFGKIVNVRFTSKLPGAQPETIFSSGQESVLKIPTQSITTSKSKIQLKLPQGKFESIKVILKFKPNINEIIFGVRGNEKDDFFYQSLYRDVFRDLNWNKVEDSGFTLWQKEKKFNNLKDFIDNPPLDKRIVSYSLNLDKLQEIKTDADKKDKKARTVIEIPLRGGHNLQIKVDQNPLILKVAKQDLNYYEGEDKLGIIISKDGKKLEEKTIKDDGVIDNSRLRSAVQEETITLQDTDPGIYEVKLVDLGNKGDILITKIEVNQSKIIFKSQIFPLANTQTTFWTNIDKLNISTVHDLGIQTIKLDDQYDLKIEQIDKQYSFDLRELTKSTTTNKIYKLMSPKNDLMIIGSGYFSFTKDALFLPEIIKADNLNDLDNLENVDYILTSYNLPKKEGDWMIAEAYFDLKDIKVDGDTLYFSLEVPQIVKYGGQLEIDYLDISLGTKDALEKTKIQQEKSSNTDKQDEKQNIVQKGKEWLGAKWNQLTNWVNNTWQQLFKKKSGTITITNPKLSPSPSPTPSPIPSPSPKEKISLLVKVLNGGAEKGAAGMLAKVLESAGFTNVVADTAEKTDYKNATIIYRKEDLAIMAKLNDLLRKDYKEVTRKEIATTSAEIVVIIGEK